MNSKFSPRVQKVIQFSREEALRLGHDFIGTEHLLLGIVRLGEGSAVQILESLDVDLESIREMIEEIVESTENTMRIGNIPFTKKAERVLKVTYMEGKNLNSESIGTEHLLLAITREDDGIAAQVLESFNITYNTARDQRKKLLISRESSGEEAAARSKSKTPALDHFGRDLTRMARDDELDPIIGRDQEIERVAQVLSRRKKNNPVLIGEPGVGKTAIAEGLALRIVERKVPHSLQSKRVVSLDLGGLVAGTKYRGQFEERIKTLMTELGKNREIILFLDELHTIVGAGSASGSLDASNMFKPALARGDMQCIGATTLDEYRQTVEKDGALERRFQKILVEPSTLQDTIKILEGLKEKYEEHHNVIYSPAALVQAVRLSDRFITDRQLPDKAIDVIDETGSRIHLANIVVPQRIIEIEERVEQLKQDKERLVEQQQYEQAASLRDEKVRLEAELAREREVWEQSSQDEPVTITPDDIGHVVSMMTGIPVSRVDVSESERLLKMEEVVGAKIVGQEEAIRLISRTIRRSRAGFKNPSRPIGSFLFLGPSGVGKTELAKVLAEFLFDDPDALVRIDMSEYMEKFAVSRLIGAPPGYVGYDEGGQLTEKVRRRPYSVVLLDEMEKAHPEVFNIMLQVLDEGQLTDNSGRQVSFRNTIIIMTSNVGTREVFSGSRMGFGQEDGQAPYEQIRQRLLREIRDTYRPEFINRIDELVVFRMLQQPDIMKIIDIYLTELQERLTERDIKLVLTPGAREFIAEMGYTVDSGVRLLRRMIERHVEDPIAEEVLRGSFADGCHIRVRRRGKELEFLPASEHDAV
ncbi:MAG: ATP-dependent Clp protease ATP-binding subunit [Candidatus Delongbacteria bacterium]|nr:ATP-dependent Clp protease ATP-binding subunit [Candidatus Delongbacteria bacterium]